MKRTLLLLLLLFLLTGCSREAPAEETPPPNKEITEETTTPIEAPAPEEETTEPEAVPAPEPEPDKDEAIPLPPLPNSIYCTGDTAVDSNGNVVLHLTNRTLSPLYDSVTGQLRAIVAVRDYRADALYDLSGRLLFENLNAVRLGCSGDLFWYRSLTSATLTRLSDQTVLEDNLELVETAGTLTAVQPSFWSSPCTLVDSSGEPVRQLDRGFRLTAAHDWQDQTWLVLEAPDGTQTLTNATGDVCLPGFYTEILNVDQGCALVRQENHYLAVDLTSGETVLRLPYAFTFLKNAALADTGSDGSKTLLDLNGQTIFTGALAGSYACDADGNGTYDLILCQVIRDGEYATTVLTTDGRQFCTLPTQIDFVQPLSPTQVLCLIPDGQGYLQTALLRNLTDSTETTLCSGAYLQVEPISTTQGQYFLCRSSSGGQEICRVLQSDGTQVLPDMSRCSYAGGDVFDCTMQEADGLLCLNGAWLYRR